MSTRTRRSRPDGADQTAASNRNDDRSGNFRDVRAELPTRDYLALVTIFNGALATALLAQKCSKEPLADRVDPKDIVLFALATQKLSRVITKDKVTTGFRAPF